MSVAVSEQAARPKAPFSSQQFLETPLGCDLVLPHNPGVQEAQQVIALRLELENGRPGTLNEL